MDADMWRDPFAAADLPTFHAELLPAGATAYRVDYLLVHGDPGRCPVIGIDRLFTEPVAVPHGGLDLSLGPRGAGGQDRNLLSLPLMVRKAATSSRAPPGYAPADARLGDDAPPAWAAWVRPGEWPSSGALSLGHTLR